MKPKPGKPMEEHDIELRDDRDRQIVRSIEQLPDLEAPPELVTTVMQSLKPKMLPWWRRVHLWAKAPKEITFTPIRLVPAAMTIVAIFALWTILLSPDKGRLNVQVQASQRLPVVFTLNIPGASSVSVIGTFNQWKAQGFEMKGDKERGIWSATLWLPKGRHEYAFLVDGNKVIPDPQAALYEEDGFGSRNSVLVLRGENGEHT